ncbi:XRE family transcriptional regulator [Pseudoprevotella muciniphila]|uniref:XRE family transcriptional regulator n=1 Tax=Pseudoprevotella muciniphila TaxID=2133944 RepID=A0A5P8E5G0_9BACT|nr:helix-turn-helix transcriptional regulator [Pseudoprevotella muciniphila]QFQ12157.1 XRE family transcriptional regulator [Pseudoprevotella muciniphila]
MNKEKQKAILAAKNFSELLDVKYGKRGEPERERFEVDAIAFYIAEVLKAEREEAGLTQQQLADKIGTKKSYISKVENGDTDVHLSILSKIFAGLGKRVSLTIT